MMIPQLFSGWPPIAKANNWRTNARLRSRSLNKAATSRVANEPYLAALLGTETLAGSSPREK